MVPDCCNWQIEYMHNYPNALARILNRSGRLVFEQRGGGRDFDGGLGVTELSVGSYYYVIDLGSGCEPL